MPSKERDVVRNILRLLQKARRMDRAEVADYLRPLIALIELYTPQTADAANALAAVTTLIHSSSADADASPELWSSAIHAIEVWDNHLT
jgi:hypothetical protein